MEKSITTKLLDVLKMLDIESTIRKQIDSPQLTKYCFDVKDSRTITKLNKKAMEVISDYVKAKIDVEKEENIVLSSRFQTIKEKCLNLINYNKDQILLQISN